MKIKYISMAAFVLLAIATQKEVKATELYPNITPYAYILNGPSEGDIFEWVQTQLSEKLKIKKELITMESKLITDLGMDSLDILEFMNAISEQYGIDYDTKLATICVLKNSTVKDIINCILAWI